VLRVLRGSSGWGSDGIGRVRWRAIRRERDSCGEAQAFGRGVRGGLGGCGFGAEGSAAEGRVKKGEE